MTVHLTTLHSSLKGRDKGYIFLLQVGGELSQG